MSASTERKNRQAARSEGTYRKDILAQEEAAKKKKQSIKWIIVGVALVIFFAIAIYINTGAMYRSLSALDVSSTEVTVGDITVPAVERSFSVAECNYVYNMQFVNFYNTYGSYASMFGLDVNSPLDEQSCPMAPEDQKDNYTWDDYFRDATKSLLTQMAAFEAYAKANDITLDKSDLESVDKTVSAIEDAAKENNYRNASKFLAAQYGKGTNESVARGILELEALANKVQLAITGAQSYTADQLTEKYESVKDSYDKFTYSYYLVAVETEKNEDGTAADPTDEAKAAAHATAEAILAGVNGGSTLADAAKAAVEGAEIKEQSALAGSSVEADIAEWVKSADRKAGDSAVVDGSSGSYVVIFTARDNNQAPTEESGDMNYCDYVAKNLLDQDALSKWNTDVFSKITDVFTASYLKAARYVGR